MYKIQIKINEYLTEYGARKLMQEIGIGSGTIYSIKNGHKNKKYTPQVLDILYDYFKLEKDDFYTKNIKQNSGLEEPLGVLFKKRREKLGYKREQVAKMIKGSNRHLRRIEAGDSTFRINSYYLKELIKLYKFNSDESNQIMSYVLSLSDIINLSKKENVLE